LDLFDLNRMNTMNIFCLLEDNYYMENNLCLLFLKIPLTNGTEGGLYLPYM
jgi:hypothetical protein